MLLLELADRCWKKSGQNLAAEGFADKILKKLVLRMSKVELPGWESPGEPAAVEKRSERTS